MKVIALIFLCTGFIPRHGLAQTVENYSDDFLSSSFEVFQSADFELAYHILPFLRERFVKELNDTSSFNNPFDSLSTYINIEYSSDSLVKTYCWDERNGSCCYSSASFVQFCAPNGDIQLIDLEEPEDSGLEVFIKQIHRIESDGHVYYLITGWGTCCGGKHYEIARVYEIENDNFVKVEDFFNGESELYCGANRSQKIDLKYTEEPYEISYSNYEFDDDIGFYTDKKTIVKMTLTNKGFKVNN